MCSKVVRGAGLLVLLFLPFNASHHGGVYTPWGEYHHRVMSLSVLAFVEAILFWLFVEFGSCLQWFGYLYYAFWRVKETEATL